jgi:Ubiquitin-activating enzyme E1 FCCH domain
MSIVAQANTTYAQIELLVRRLTACSSEQALPSVVIQETVNDIYNNDFPYAIKLDVMRSVYKFYTQPYVDRYPLDVNYNQGVREPVYIDGYYGYLYKDRGEFYNIYPKYPTKFQQGATSSNGYITDITQADPGQVTAPNHGLSTGNEVYISNVNGMTQVNGGIYTVTVVDANDFTIGIDTSGFSAYTIGGTWQLVPVQFNFSVAGPFLSREVTIGGTDVNGNAISINDDGYGNLYLQTPNPVVSVPPYGSVYPSGSPNAGMPIPGMYNRNLYNPGLNKESLIGQVNYVTGQFSFVLPLPLQSGTTLTIWVAQYITGRPYWVLFWNNEFHVRPVPKEVHCIEVEVYLTPVQFMKTTDSPILNQWVKYIAYSSAVEILRQRQDMEGVENLMEGFKRQEGLVLERQATEEINSRNKTIFASSQPNNGFNNGYLQGFWF